VVEGAPVVAGASVCGGGVAWRGGAEGFSRWLDGASLIPGPFSLSLGWGAGLTGPLREWTRCLDVCGPCAEARALICRMPRHVLLQGEPGRFSSHRRPKAGMETSPLQPARGTVSQPASLLFSARGASAREGLIAIGCPAMPFRAVQSQKEDDGFPSFIGPSQLRSLNSEAEG
jgi:hypothetical protein